MGAQSLDLMIHPDFRGRGIFRALADSTFRLPAIAVSSCPTGFRTPARCGRAGVSAGKSWARGPASSDHSAAIPLHRCLLPCARSLP